jgi:hypothetical protein
MQETTTYTSEQTGRGTAVTILAVVGFLALVGIGILLAIYAARYVPTAISNLSSWGEDPALTAVPTTTLPFYPPTSPATTTPTYTPPVATTTPQPTIPPSYTPSPAPAAPITYYQTITTPYPLPGSIKIPAPTIYYGLPNLSIVMVTTGYMSGSRFIPDSTPDADDDFAVQILVRNTGTNKTGTWEIHTVIPTTADSTFVRDEDQPSLEPGGSILLTLELDRGELRTGDDREIFIEIDSDHDVRESNESDNRVTKRIDVHD